MYPDLDMCYTFSSLLQHFFHLQYVLFQIQPTTCLMSPVKEYYLDIITCKIKPQKQETIFFVLS